MKEGDKVEWTSNNCGQVVRKTGVIFKTYVKLPIWLIRRDLDGELSSIHKDNLQLIKQ